MHLIKLAVQLGVGAVQAVGLRPQGDLAVDQVVEELVLERAAPCGGGCRRVGGQGERRPTDLGRTGRATCAGSGDVEGAHDLLGARRQRAAAIDADGLLGQPGAVLGHEPRAVAYEQEGADASAATGTAPGVDHGPRAVGVVRAPVAQDRPPGLPERHAQGYVTVDRGEEVRIEPTDRGGRLAAHHEAVRSGVVDGVHVVGDLRGNRDLACRPVPPDEVRLDPCRVGRVDARADSRGLRTLDHRGLEPRGTTTRQHAVLVDRADEPASSLPDGEVVREHDADISAVVEHASASSRAPGSELAHLVVGVVEDEEQLGGDVLRRDRPQCGRGPVGVPGEDDGEGDVGHAVRPCHQPRLEATAPRSDRHYPGADAPPTEILAVCVGPRGGEGSGPHGDRPRPPSAVGGRPNLG